MPFSCGSCPSSAIKRSAIGLTAYLLYQQDLRDTESLEDIGIEVVDVRQNQAASQTILDMEILDGAEGLQLMIDFSASWYKEKSMQEFARIFAGTAQLIAQHDGQTDLTIREITRRIRQEVIREVIGEKVSDERARLGKVEKKIAEAPHRLRNADKRALEGPDRRLDSEERFLSENLHRHRDIGIKLPDASHMHDTIKEKVKESGTLLKNFSTKIRRKR